MKLNLISIVLLSIIISSCGKKMKDAEHQHENLSADTVPPDTVKKSIPKDVHHQLGGAHLIIKYHAPAVRGRTIWGGLVPYNDVWVTGAHKATSFEIDKDFIVEEKTIAAGKYALFSIPKEGKWTFIINKNWDQHLADEYDQKDDLVRIDVTPEQLPNVQERLKYSIVSIDDSKGAIEISWEKVKLSLPIQIK